MINCTWRVVRNLSNLERIHHVVSLSQIIQINCVIFLLPSCSSLWNQILVLLCSLWQHVRRYRVHKLKWGYHWTVKLFTLTGCLPMMLYPIISTSYVNLLVIVLSGVLLTMMMMMMFPDHLILKIYFWLLLVYNSNALMIWLFTYYMIMRGRF